MPIALRPARRRCCFLAVTLFAATGTAAAEPFTEPLTLEAAVAQALATNPGVARSRAQAEARAAIPSQAGALPDPWLSIEPGRAAMDQLTLGIRQELPYPGKRDLRRDVARHEAEAAAQEAGEAELRMAAEVKQAWWRLFSLDRALETVRRTQEIMRQLVNVAETRYRVGSSVQQDVLRAQLGVSTLLAEEIELTGQRRAAEAGLNTLLYRPATMPVMLPATVSEVLPDILSEENLVQRAAARPLLVAQQRRIEAASSELELARKDYRPDFSLGAEYEMREGEEDMRSVMLEMSLPLRSGSRQDHGVDQRGAELLEQRYALEDAQNQVTAEIAAARADYLRSREQAQLLKDGIIPQATQTVASMLAGYQVGKLDFFNLSDTQIMLFGYETRYWQIFSEAHAALARLAAAVGQEAVYE